MPMNFLFHLFLDLKNWCISVEEEAGALPLPACPHYAYSYTLAYASPYITYMGVR